MLVSWTATDLGSRRFSAMERSSDLTDLTDHFTALRTHGQGYLEVRLPAGEFPLLALGFRDDQAVIHLFSDPERSSLHVGDGTAAADAVVQVPITDDSAAFGGDCVLAVDHAWALMLTFVQAGRPDELGEWREL
ncbi:hypothetical protein ACFSUJ_27800 [Streptomyces lusitanus]|uniref:Uncharacterized protein n=1 Tax=Streptomyces lusitanus TaxID=68232 RepID=A0ABU3JXX4_9ACTN|nr:hypothetical protein [Streptomyces lusitanus]